MKLKEKNIENTEFDNNIEKKEKEILKIEKKLNNDNSTTEETFENSPIQEIKKKNISTFSLIILILICILLFIFTVFTFYNILNPYIINGVSIRGIDVSNKSKSDAKYIVNNYIENNMPTEIKLKHADYETSISLDQINAKFDLTSASNNAFAIGRKGNVFQNNLYVFSTLFNNVNIQPNVKFDKKQLSKTLSELSANFPDKVEESSYYIEGNKLIITPGKDGVTVDVEKTIDLIKDTILNFEQYKEPLELVVKTEHPQPINIEKIYNEIKKEPKNAYYTQNPFCVYPSENGMDFNIALEEAKNIISKSNQSEYVIPLKIIYPKVTTNMIGSEAFPDLLSTFSTNYNARDRNRTTNLILAANKINGTVLMPGETFSYNKIVGARTIAAGYKEAPIYVQGKVVDGLGGGICQITSTLYNAVVLANLQVIERTNHQFVPSYVTASRDATVVYGALDFKFKNNRNYPIKINCSVSGGVANFKIFGLHQDNDYQVTISSYVTGRTPNALYSEAYKILKKNGKVIKRELLSKDTYKRH